MFRNTCSVCVVDVEAGQLAGGRVDGPLARHEHEPIEGHGGRIGADGRGQAGSLNGAMRVARRT